MHHCDHALSVVRPSSLTFHIFDFSSERNSTKPDRKQDLIVHYRACVFFFRVDQNKQDGRLGRSVKKVAHCTQVHDIWHFGPLVLSWIYLSCSTLYIGKLLRLLCKPSARYIFIDNEIQYVFFKKEWFILVGTLTLIFLYISCLYSCYLSKPEHYSTFYIFVTLVPFAVWSW